MNPGQCNGDTPDAGATSAPESDLVEVAVGPMLVRGTLPSFLRSALLVIVAFPVFAVAVALFVLLLAAAENVAELMRLPVGAAYAAFVVFGALVMVLAILLGGVRARRRLRRRLRDVQTPLVNRVSNALCDAMKHQWYEGDARLVYEILLYLVEQGWVGRTLRVCPTDAGTPVDPFDVPFEPLPLAEGSHAVRELLRRALNGGLVHGDHAPGRRRQRRFLTSRMRLIVIGVGTALVAWLLGTRMWVVPLALLGILLAMRALFDHAGFPRSIQWLIVPGGVVRRKAGWFRQHWDVQLFDRRRAVLVICLVRRGDWWFAITDGQRRTRGHLSPGDCEALLRAWRSPLTPPSVELLSELR